MRGGEQTALTPRVCRQNGETPLVCAARYGHLEVVRLLLEKGANKEAADKVRDDKRRGRTPAGAAPTTTPPPFPSR